MALHLVTTLEAAQRIERHDRTIRNWVKTGRIRGYIDGDRPRRTLLVDLAEVSAQDRKSRRAPYGSYGKSARIVQLRDGADS